MEVVSEAQELLDAALQGLSGDGGAVGGGGGALELLATVVPVLSGDGGRIPVSEPFCEDCWVEVISGALELLDAALQGLIGEGGAVGGGGGVLVLLAAVVPGLSGGVAAVVCGLNGDGSRISV